MFSDCTLRFASLSGIKKARTNSHYFVLEVRPKTHTTKQKGAPALYTQTFPLLLPVVLENFGRFRTQEF